MDYGDLTVTLSGNRFVGRFNERAPTAFTHWEGPILLMKTDVTPAAPLVGRWKGEVELVDSQDELPFSVDMTINSLTVGAIAGAIEYPSLRCGGTLTLLSASGNEFRFRERIGETSLCTDDGLLVLTVTGDALDFRWSYPESESVDAAGILDRSEFDALTDCPCIPPPGTVSPEQTSADVAGFVQNLLKASDAAPRCGELRSSFYENYQPDKIALELSHYEQERRCTLNTAGILRDAANHTVGIDGELVALPVAEGELPVATLFDAFTGFYREVRGLRDLTSGVQNVAPRSLGRQISVTTHLERSFAGPAGSLRDITETLVEATVVLNPDERDLVAAGDYFADAFQTRSGRASAVLAVTRVSDDGDEVEVALHSFVNGTRCAGDCDSLGEVTVNEIITLVNIALGTADVSGCTPGDSDHNSDITVDEILSAVNAALSGCSVLAG